MLELIKNLLGRFSLCVFSFHKQGEKFQSHRGLDMYTCSRCNTVFGVSRVKTKQSK